MLIYNLTKDDSDLVYMFAKCSLERSPGKNDNWVERAGKLPPYIEEIACALHRKGRSISSSIAIAVSRVKRWASGGDNVTAATRAKAAKAVAQWTALRAKNAARKLKLSSYPDGTEYIVLSEVDSYSLDQVRIAWEAKMSSIRSHYRNQEIEAPYAYVREVWSDYIIIEVENPRHFLKIPYTVEDREIVFHVAEEVEQRWVAKE